MSHVEPNQEFNGAEEVKWNLKDLYRSRAQLESDLTLAEKRADQFNRRFHGALAGLDSSELAEGMRQIEEIVDRTDRAMTYAYLHWCTNTEDPSRGALLQQVRERVLEIEKLLLFFELEIINLSEDLLAQHINNDRLDSYKHYLETLFLRKPHLLSEAEEKILSEKAITGPEAWGRFFDETFGAARFQFQGRDLTEQEILSKLYDSDRSTRREAAMTFTEGLRAKLRQLTFVFNTMLAEKASDDRLRGYPHWLSARNLSNEIGDEAVAALVGAVTERFDIVARFYRLKRDLLDLEALFDYDRYAPIAPVNRKILWEEAQEIVLSSYASFHPKMGDIARNFFRGAWIDAAVRPGKRGGAFSHRAVPQAHPYILLNYTGNLRDIQTLAHELGHGVHQYLARSQGAFHSRTPLTTSETASVFGEMLVFENLMRRETDPKQRLGMLIGKIGDTTATVFRQIAMNRFEALIHEHRRTRGELSADDFCEYWMQTQGAMFQDSVTLGDHYRIWWSYIPHFIHTPGYVYAYAFGELLVLAIYARYREEGPVFAEEYLEVLRAGGSDWPHALVARLGIDLQDPDFWSRGLSSVEALVDEAEELAKA
ncbi:MAG TPA: M3 family oligoendopeptidase [Acidobacteriota bacterium]|nr:M3 family oligoendopeptidase [Acidobacteriota bacterium]